MNVVSLSLCYPSEENPHAGLFVRTRLTALSAHLNVRVVHAVPTAFWSTLCAKVHQYQGPPQTWRVPFAYLPLISKPLNPFLYARAVYPLIATWARRGDVDIIDAHFSWPDGVAAARLAQLLGLPYAVTLRGVLGRYVQDPTKRRSIIRALRQAAAVIAVSDSLKQLALRLGVSPEKTHLIPNGIDTDLFKPADRNAARDSLERSVHETMLITVGHLCRRKGVHRVLELLPELVGRDGRIRYVVIGTDGAEGRFAAKLHRLTRRLGLKAFVTFTGALDAPKIARWLQAADLFVLPTRNEGCCNALCEAVATGLPVVCTDVGGNREIVKPIAGTLVPLGDKKALFEAICRSLDFGVQRNAVSQPAPSRPWSQVGRETAVVLRNAVVAGTHA